MSIVDCIPENIPINGVYWVTYIFDNAVSLPELAISKQLSNHGLKINVPTTITKIDTIHLTVIHLCLKNPQLVNVP